KYTTSVTKTKAADYGHIKCIEDLVPHAMWIQEPISYDNHALWGVSHWGRKRQQFYGFAVNRESSLDVYSKRRIIAVTKLKIVEWHNYKHLDWISVLVEAYDDADKTILDTYGELPILKKRREEDDDQEGPSVGSDRGSKRRREEDFSNFIMNRLGVDTLTPKLLAGPTYELMRGSCNSLTELEYHLEEVYKATTDQLDWVNLEGQQYPHNLLQPLPLIPDNRGRRVISFEHFINNDLEYLRGDLVPCAMGIQEPINYDKHALWGVSHWGQKHQQFYEFAVNRESTLDVYSKRRIIAVTELKIVEWHNYKHLDWISRRVEDLQLGFESYLKRLNLIKPDTYRSDLKRREAYTAYSNPIGSIYQNKDKKNRLMQIDELHKFSDGTLNDVRNALDDCLKGIRMQYLPTTIWRRGDKDRAVAMIQAIDKILKTRRIMRSLERFVGGRQYEGDFWMLQRTI
nr:hypothetical protein [Tanacetum cinerariifolium]